MKTRKVEDSMGTLEVPADALWGAQTQRAVQNFPISGLTMPRQFIRALGLIKAANAAANRDLKLVDAKAADAIEKAALAVASGEFDAHFPVDVFQTGSGTSSNMNANEVIAQIANNAGADVHPNDHVNYGQSSNDVIPSALQLSACLATDEILLPALEHLSKTLAKKAKALSKVVKTGRTHLMDAMPVTFGQELGCYQKQIDNGIARIKSARERVGALPIGGTAVGTGINAHPEARAKVCAYINKNSNLAVKPSDNPFEGISSVDAAAELSGQLKTLACSLMKISNDLRWMNSGPIAGLGEISLPSLQPGSSIMPGKVNPVIPEAMCMVCAQVIGNDAAISIGAQSGTFELNVMMPMVAYNLLQSIEIMASATRALADKAIDGFTVNEESINAKLMQNPILVTALNSVIGYELGAKIAKTAFAERRSLVEVTKEMTELSEKEILRLLDPSALTEGGIRS